MKFIKLTTKIQPDYSKRGLEVEKWPVFLEKSRNTKKMGAPKRFRENLCIFIGQDGGRGGANPWFLPFGLRVALFWGCGKVGFVSFFIGRIGFWGSRTPLPPTWQKPNRKNLIRPIKNDINPTFPHPRKNPTLNPNGKNHGFAPPRPPS